MSQSTIQNITQADLARKLQIDRSTVSLCFSNPEKVKDETLKQVMSLAENLGYRPNAGARMIRQSKTHQIGVVLCNEGADHLAHPMQFETILGINEGFQSSGYIVNLLHIHDVEQSLQESSRAFLEHRMDGVVVIGHLPENLARQLSRMSIPCIWTDANIWERSGCVRRDETQAGYLAAWALAELDYKKWLWLGRGDDEQTHYSFNQRYNGVCKMALECGAKLEVMHVNPNFVFTDEVDVEHLFKSNQGIITNSFYMARWLIGLGNMMGLRPGYDYAITCPDSGRDADRFMPFLSRVDYDRFEMGLQAAEMLMHYLKHGRHRRSRILDVYWHPGTTAWPCQRTKLPVHIAKMTRGI